MSVVIADEYLRAARLSAAELLQEVAVMLFAQQRLTLGQASHLAGMGQIPFPASSRQSRNTVALRY